VDLCRGERLPGSRYKVKQRPEFRDREYNVYKVNGPEQGRYLWGIETARARGNGDGNGKDKGKRKGKRRRPIIEFF
jgi:hypothetical protein